MKITKLSLFALVLTFAGCSTSGLVYDDVYYSRKSGANVEARQMAEAPQQNTVSTPSSNSEYEYQTYYNEGQNVQSTTTSPDAVYSTTETVVEPDGTSYSTTETYYNSEYAQRMRRFNGGGGSSFGYYDSFNTGCFDCYNSSFKMGFG